MRCLTGWFTRGCGWMGVGLMLAGLGCAAQHHRSGTPLADTEAVLPAHVSLPPGFYPVRNLYEDVNDGDHYNGWPRHIVCERDHMVMVYVPSQEFTLGDGLGNDEVPGRTVVVNHFYVDLHEVTNEQFHRFCASGSKGAPRRHGVEVSYAHDPYAYDPYWSAVGQPEGRPGQISLYANYWSPGLNNNHPARNVSWWEAWYYTKWSGRQLPTESQWEAAARGGDRRIYPWGNEPHSEITDYLCNARTTREDFDGYEYTAPVLSYAAGVSPYGVYNMAGNVAEWCRDWYDPGRYAFPSEEDPPSGLERGPKPFGDHNYHNPLDKTLRESRIGPLRGDERAIRGGSFADAIQLCRADARTSARPEAHAHNVGFRCVLALPPEEAPASGG